MRGVEGRCLGVMQVLTVFNLGFVVVLPNLLGLGVQAKVTCSSERYQYLLEVRVENLLW